MFNGYFDCVGGGLLGDFGVGYVFFRLGLFVVFVGCLFGVCMSDVLVVRVGRGRRVVIPRRFAEALGIVEGSLLMVRVVDGRLVLEPVLDAVALSLRGRKVAETSLRGFESESVERQRKYIGEGRGHLLARFLQPPSGWAPGITNSEQQPIGWGLKACLEGIVKLSRLDLAPFIP